MFLLPGVVVAWYVTGTIVPEVYKIEIRNYLFARQYRLREGRESTDDTDEREKSEKLADDTEADDTEADDYRDEEDVAGVGGWGLHIEGRSSVFGTTMNYLALRLLDTDADHPNMVAARACLHRLGGAVCAPLWAKFWLALLGLADWDFVNPVPPELWYVTAVHRATGSGR